MRWTVPAYFYPKYNHGIVFLIRNNCNAVHNKEHFEVDNLDSYHQQTGNIPTVSSCLETSMFEMVS